MVGRQGQSTSQAVAGETAQALLQQHTANLAPQLQPLAAQRLQAPRCHLARRASAAALALDLPLLSTWLAAAAMPAMAMVR